MLIALIVLWGITIIWGIFVALTLKMYWKMICENERQSRMRSPNDHWH